MIRPHCIAVWIAAACLCAQVTARAEAPGSIDELEQRFVQAPDYCPRQVEVLMAPVIETLKTDGSSAFRPDHALSPLARAALIMSANEPDLPHARYRVRFGVIPMPAPPKADPVPVSFIQIERFNLAPAVRARLIEVHGADKVAPPEHFGIGGHVSYRLITRPVMGQVADVVAVSRRSIDPSEADAAECFGKPCTGVSSPLESVRDWDGPEAVELDFSANYPISDGELPVPAAVLDWLAMRLFFARVSGGTLRWTGPEPREGPDPGQPFVEAVLEYGLGQDRAFDAVMVDDHVMDHAVRAVWQRLRGAAGMDRWQAQRSVQHRPGMH